MTRHRKYQIAITFGVVATTILGHYAPDLQHFAVLGTIATNLAWIWEA